MRPPQANGHGLPGVRRVPAPLGSRARKRDMFIYVIVERSMFIYVCICLYIFLYIHIRVDMFICVSLVLWAVERANEIHTRSQGS